jgi:hypothetical protein
MPQRHEPPCGGRARSALLLGAGLIALAAAATLWLAQQRENRQIDAGRAIFEGGQALDARIAGHESPLPAQASRCVNCHGAPAGSEPVPASVRPLSAATLAEPVARRGGPPSRYDARSLCTLLRSGVDPAHVMVQRAMPRFDIDDLQCEALWQYLRKR